MAGSLIMQRDNQVSMIAAGSWDIGAALARNFGPEGTPCVAFAGTNIDHCLAAGKTVSG